jgi:hypothetical protein
MPAPCASDAAAPGIEVYPPLVTMAPGVEPVAVAVAVDRVDIVVAVIAHDIARMPARYPRGSVSAVAVTVADPDAAAWKIELDDRIRDRRSRLIRHERHGYRTRGNRCLPHHNVHFLLVSLAGPPGSQIYPATHGPVIPPEHLVGGLALADPSRRPARSFCCLNRDEVKQYHGQNESQVNETFIMRMRCRSPASAHAAPRASAIEVDDLVSNAFPTHPKGLETLPAGCHIL